MVLPDNHPDKWEYTPTTRQKHRILGAYIWPWTSKITSFTDNIRIFDCFAGRGSYSSGVEGLDLNHLDLPVERPGSPFILLDRVMDFEKRVDEENRIDSLDLVCIENDSDNYENLRDLLDKVDTPDYVSIKLFEGKFQDRIGEAIEETGGSYSPSFFFIDPFGFEPLRFDVFREFAPVQGNDFLLTLMARDINRFLPSTKHEVPLSKVFGVEVSQIKEKVDEGSSDRCEQLVDYYSSDVLEDKMDVSHTLYYKMCEPDSRKVLYYLVFGSNHIDGLKLAKEICYRKGPEGRFAFVKRGPESQSPLTEFAKTKVDRAKDLMTSKFEGQIVTFDWIIAELAEETKYDLIEKHFRSAVKELEEEEKVSINRKEGKEREGLRKKDMIAFESIN